MKWVWGTLVAYVLLVLGAGLWLYRGYEMYCDVPWWRVEYIARVDLVKNRRLAPLDLQWAPKWGDEQSQVGDDRFLDKYLLVDVAKGCPVEIGDVGDAPDLQLPNEGTLIRYPLGDQPELARLLHPRQTVTICRTGDAPELLGQFRLAAVVEDEEKGDVALLEANDARFEAAGLANRTALVPARIDKCDRTRRSTEMAEPSWTQLVEMDVPAKPDGRWTLVSEYVEKETLLRIRADPKGSWSYTKRVASGCGPNGEATSHLKCESCLLESAPPGSLIGKIGGSTVDSGSAIFSVGSFAVTKLSESGPVYLTVNDEPGGFVDNSGSIKVTVSTAPAASEN